MRSADLHFHLLPGVDDGPADLVESLELARAAVPEGTDAVVESGSVRSGSRPSATGARAAHAHHAQAAHLSAESA
jgi:tyrosine-protein phosphatase YwqE